MSNPTALPMYHIEMKPDSNKPRVAGHGITVQFLAILHHNPEWTVERICEGYSLTPAQVYAAWAYYYDHKDEIDQAIEADEAAMERLANDPAYQARVKALKEKASHRSEPTG